MKIIIIFFWLLLCGILRSWAQESCAMQLQTSELLAQKKFGINHQAGDIELLPGTTITLKLKPHIIRRSNGTGGLAISSLQQAIQQLNQAYQEHNISFDLCTINYIDKDSYYSGINLSRDKDSEEFEMAHANRVDDAVNVFFIPNTAYCGWSSFPFYKELYDKDWTVMKNSCTTNGSTFAHEIGHYLDLYHTHETTFGVENVTKTLSSCVNCEAAGDLLCDTPADPRLSGQVDQNCNYTGNQRDACNVLYTPDVSNIMSYAPKSCRTTFSPGQSQRMRMAITMDRQHVAAFCSDCKVNKTITENVPIASLSTESVQKSLVVSNKIAVGAKVAYDAGNEVILKNGFHAVSGSFFRAIIEGCSLVQSGAKQLASKKVIRQKIVDPGLTSITREITVYPNPSKGSFTIGLNRESDITLQVYQLDGQLVLERSFEATNRISLNDALQQSGIYLLRLYTENQVFVKKIIKN